MKNTKRGVVFLIILILIFIIISLLLREPEKEIQIQKEYVPTIVKEYIYIEKEPVNKEKQENENTETSFHLMEVGNVLELPKEEIVEYEVNCPSSRKTWTNYRLLAKNTPQGKLQEIAYTDEYGLRKVDDYYCVAMGTYYSSTVGDKFLITLENGSKFKVIICDIKSDRHTDPKNQYTVVSKCMLEFYVDDNLYPMAKRMGDCSYIPGFEGIITHVDKIPENI